MVRAKAMDRPLEDSLDELVLSGMDAGLMPDLDGNDMPVDGAAACSNIMFDENGSFQSRLGWVRRFQVMTGADVTIDGAAEFLDSTRSQRRVVWANGNLYDCTTMDAGSIVEHSGVYASGSAIAWAAMYGELVYSDGVTIGTGSGGAQSGCRVYEPIDNTDAVLEGEVGDLFTEIPAAKAMCTYDSCLVLGNLLFPDGTRAPESVVWSRVGDVRGFYATSQRGVAIGDGGQIVALQPFTLSNENVAPSNGIFVGKDGSCSFSLRGPVSDLEEIRIKSSTGVIDGNTVSFIPYTKGGVVVYLGNDRQFYVTNGVTADSIVEDRIRKEVKEYINERLSANPTQRFYAGRNYLNNQYVCNLGGGRWYAFDWNRVRWTRYDGWPDGAVLETINSSRQHQLYILELDRVTEAPSLAVQMCQMNSSRADNQASINPYWESCWLRGGIGQNGENTGSINKSKLWYFCTLDYATDFGAIKLEFTPNQGQGATQSYVIPAFAQNSAAEYDSAEYDDSTYSGAGVLVPKTVRFRIPRVNSRGEKSIFQGRDIKVRISLDESTPQALFKVNSLSLAFTERGMSHV